jgi:hypothetical protein
MKSVSQSFFCLFIVRPLNEVIFLKNTKMTKSCWSQVSNPGPSKWKSNAGRNWTHGMKSFYLSLNGNINVKCQYKVECHGWQTSSYFLLVSVQSHTVKFNWSVRRPDKKTLRKTTDRTNKQTHRSVGGNTFNGKNLFEFIQWQKFVLNLNVTHGTPDGNLSTDGLRPSVRNQKKTATDKTQTQKTL